MKTKTKITLLIILLLTSAGAIFAATTNYYSDVSLDSGGIDGASVSGNLIELPIIATYDPGIITTFTITAENGSNIENYGSTYTNPSVNEYETDIYDITSDETTETFSIHYLSNEDAASDYMIYIDYGTEWYSVSDTSKHTGQDISLSYNLLNNSDGYSISYYTTNSGYFKNPKNNDSLKYYGFRLYSEPGYINSEIMTFKFTWDAKTLDEINNLSSGTFSSGEEVESVVYIQIYDD